MQDLRRQPRARARAAVKAREVGLRERAVRRVRHLWQVAARCGRVREVPSQAARGGNGDVLRAEPGSERMRALRDEHAEPMKELGRVLRHCQVLAKFEREQACKLNHRSPGHGVACPRRYFRRRGNRRARGLCQPMRLKCNERNAFPKICGPTLRVGVCWLLCSGRRSSSHTAALPNGTWRGRREANDVLRGLGTQRTWH